jgi:hypothetical protein
VPVSSTARKHSNCRIFIGRHSSAGVHWRLGAMQSIILHYG